METTKKYEKYIETRDWVFDYLLKEPAQKNPILHWDRCIGRGVPKGAALIIDIPPEDLTHNLIVRKTTGFFNLYNKTKKEILDWIAAKIKKCINSSHETTTESLELHFRSVNDYLKVRRDFRHVKLIINKLGYVDEIDYAMNRWSSIPIEEHRQLFREPGFRESGFKKIIYDYYFNTVNEEGYSCAC